MTWCLDWREVCDGKADCWPNHVDEHFCEKLEQNECASNEYRCFNGQCIQEIFLLDNTFVPDCVDGTDEHFVINVEYENACRKGDQSFRCADIMCRHWSLDKIDNCGRQRCGIIDCRDILLRQLDHDLLLPTVNTHINEQCWATMICLVQAQARQQFSLVSHKIISQIHDTGTLISRISGGNYPYIIHLNNNQSLKQKI
jgi:hypothetical protein